jgi:hypothetical protein
MKRRLDAADGGGTASKRQRIISSEHVIVSHLSAAVKLSLCVLPLKSRNIEYLAENKVDVANLSARLEHAIDKRDELSSEQSDLAQGGTSQVRFADVWRRHLVLLLTHAVQSMFFVPMLVRERAFEPDIHHPACVFRFLTALSR